MKSAHKVAVVWLVNQGLDVNAINNSGQTAAHKLISWNRSRERLQILRYLIFKGASLDTNFAMNVKSVKELAIDLHKSWKELHLLISYVDEIRKSSEDLLEIGKSGIPLTESQFISLELYHWLSQVEWEIQNYNFNRKFKMQSILWFKLKSKEQSRNLHQIMANDSDYFALIYSLNQFNSSSPPTIRSFSATTKFSPSSPKRSREETQKFMSRLTDRKLKSDQSFSNFNQTNQMMQKTIKNDLPINRKISTKDLMNNKFESDLDFIEEDNENDENGSDDLISEKYLQIYQSKMKSMNNSLDHRLNIDNFDQFEIVNYTSDYFDFIQKCRCSSLSDLKFYYSKLIKNPKNRITKSKDDFNHQNQFPYIDIFGNNPLHLACGYKSGRNFEVVRWLVEEISININEKNKESNSSFTLAIQYSSLEIVKYLLDHGASPHSFHYNFFYNVIHFACLRKNDFSFDNNNNNNNNDNNNNDKLKNSTEISKNNNGNFLSKEEQRKEHIEIIKLLLDHCDNFVIDVNGLATEYQLTPLLLLIQMGNFDENIIELLIEKGGYVHAIDSLGNNILHFACSTGNIQIVQFIYEKYKINITNSINHDGRSLLHSAAQSGNLDLVRYLIERGSPLNAIDRNGFNAFLLSTKSDSASLPIARYLLALSGNEQIHHLSFQLETALHLSCGSFFIIFIFNYFN